MHKLIIPETEDTPKVNFDVLSGELTITGKSLPENINDFYDQITSWLEDYVKEPVDKTVVNFEFQYLNSASSKKVLDMVMLLKSIKEAGKGLEINWKYRGDDEDMYEEGMDYSTISRLEFNFIEQ